MPDSRPTIHTIATPTHGRYIVRRSDNQPTAGVIIGFHGYAQDAEALLADVATIPGTSEWTIASVQGLHRFYNRSRQIVASWMTSQDRELAIDDNVAYVGAVVDRVRAASGWTGPFVYLGFSQGVAMAFRAAARLDGSGAVIALGGDIPPEVRTPATRLPPVLLARGDQDSWYSREQFESDVRWLAAARVDTSVCAFAGGHAWSDEFRAAAGEFLRRLVTGSASVP